MGSVRFKRFAKPVRFTAVLARGPQGWRFRQIQFQWEGR
jgi:hypothetical protein